MNWDTSYSDQWPLQQEPLETWSATDRVNFLDNRKKRKRWKIPHSEPKWWCSTFISVIIEHWKTRRARHCRCISYHDKTYLRPCLQTSLQTSQDVSTFIHLYVWHGIRTTLVGASRDWASRADEAIIVPVGWRKGRGMPLPGLGK